MSRRILSVVVGLACIGSSDAFAQTAPAPTPAPVTPPASSTPAATAARPATEAPDDPRRRQEITPAPVQATEADKKIRFEADPIGDGALLLGTIGFSGLLELVLSTGEIRPQQIDPTFSTSNLLSIDRGALSQHIDPHAGMYSTVGLAAGVVFAVADPIVTGFRDGKEAALVDAFMYAEAGTMAWGLSDIAKVAVRRPRPIAYINRSAAIAAGTATAATYDNTSTDSTLSFFSGHAAVTSSLAAAATYIAFAREPGTVRPWITLAAGAALTSFVSIERVRAGAHFPTDVLAGALAGTGVGLLVVHMHREDTVQQRPVWVGFTPMTGGGAASFSGIF